jgi:hypothetical protein
MMQSNRLVTTIEQSVKVSPKVRRLAGSVLATLLVVATNPSQKDFTQWASDRMADKIQSVCSSSLIPFPPLGRSLCQSLALSSPPLTAEMIHQLTNRQNLVFFSIYTTKTPGLTFRTLGALGHFVTLSIE